MDSKPVVSFGTSDEASQEAESNEVPDSSEEEDEDDNWIDSKLKYTDYWVQIVKNICIN